ncbi:hypothetical protein STCU_05392 [Strigomonas culicis]|uniref:FYVE-type domain-containing protein n=1 Tax=Strigomonas culicis TaxID=28005 RepID=S9VLA8_9TRYP|nr:hypothetical protein STCU_05392 [Strigomonas culicis]|eukprot:EPY27946.1 hypothetical protein STCU_05392 [Strigomonas culicis]
MSLENGDGEKDGEGANTCDLCEKPLIAHLRRHQCRLCNGTFCYTCCNTWRVIPDIDPVEPQRVCIDCGELLQMRAARDAGRSSAHARNKDKPLYMGGSQGMYVDKRPAADRREIAVPATTTAATSHFFVDPTLNSDDSDEESDTDSEANNGVDISAAVADILSSWDEKKTNNSVSFLPVLSGNLVSSSANNVLRVLLFASETCYTVNVITVGNAETMSDLAERLSESFFKLSAGPFKQYGDVEKRSLLQRLHFSTDVQQIVGDVRALDVATHYKDVVLSTLSIEELEEVKGNLPWDSVSSLRDFFAHATSPCTTSTTSYHVEFM